MIHHRRRQNENAEHEFVSVKREGDKCFFVLGGDWTILNAGQIEQAILHAKAEVGRKSSGVIAKGIGKLDTSGALMLKRLLPKEQMPSNLTETHRSLLEFLPAFSEYKPQHKRRSPSVVRFFGGIGENSFAGLHFLHELFVFIGRVSERFARNLLHPRDFRLPSIVRHIEETGIHALPIIGLLAVLISMVITYQGSFQLRKFGADIYTIDLTVVSLLREMGVLMTAIMVAGRSGSAFAAEIGTMTLRDEVNALRTMGLDPIEVLVLPRVVALMITLPLLTFFADFIGLVGGWLMSFFLLDVSLYQYLSRVQGVADVTTFFVGMIKAPVFAVLIAIIGCYHGLNVFRSAESIGRMTTVSVVQAIFLVILADAFFSVIFSKVGI